MRNMTLAAGLALLLAGTAWCAEEEPAKAKAERPAIERLKENPSDVKALNDFGSESFSAVGKLMESDPKGALAKLDEVEKFAATLKPETPAARQVVNRITTSITAYREHIELLQTSAADIEKTLDADPNDADAIKKYIRKMSMQINDLATDKPVEAAELLEAFKARLAKLKEAATESKASLAIEQSSRSITAIERQIADARKLLELVGKDAAPLKVESWVNGSPLTDDDLKGKVVLLDFWAVWCGPCIATFPHLREWQDKYADKGLVIVGLTKYYQFQWDDDAERAVKSQGSVEPADERAMLEKFAAHHKLEHRFAVQADDSLSDYYAVRGIPHVVLIDQQGKVRMIRVGSGEANAKALAGMLDELLPAKAAE